VVVNKPPTARRRRAPHRGNRAGDVERQQPRGDPSRVTPPIPQLRREHLTPTTCDRAHVERGGASSSETAPVPMSTSAPSRSMPVLVDCSFGSSPRTCRRDEPAKTATPPTSPAVQPCRRGRELLRRRSCRPLARLREPAATSSPGTHLGLDVGLPFSLLLGSSSSRIRFPPSIALRAARRRTSLGLAVVVGTTRIRCRSTVPGLGLSSAPRPLRSSKIASACAAFHFISSSLP